MKTQKLIVSDGQTGRIDSVLATVLSDMSRTACALLCEQSYVKVNGKTVAKNYKLAPGDAVEIDLPEPKVCAAAAQDIPLDVIYMDDSLAVINKPKGMVVHPAAGNADGTMVNALLALCGDSLSAINGVIRPGIVHRIDKDTSGLLVVAKTNSAHIELAKQLKEHSIERVYHAVIVGSLPADEGVIDAPIGRSVKDRKKMAVTEKNSRNAVTHFKILERFNGYSYIECRLETGRTHQIRVHMSHIGHPIIGDTVYGLKKDSFHLNGQCLHAKVLGFTHPKTGERMVFDSDLPEYFKNILTKLRKEI